MKHSQPLTWMDSMIQEDTTAGCRRGSERTIRTPLLVPTPRELRRGGGLESVRSLIADLLIRATRREHDRRMVLTAGDQRWPFRRGFQVLLLLLLGGREKMSLVPP